jgi:endoglucanase
MLSAAEFVKGMRVGWNVGNSLEAVDNFYDPWQFTIDGDNTKVTQWGKNADPSKKADWSSDESYITAQFAKLKSKFIDEGIPVILIEYAAMLKNTTDNPPFRLAWDKYVTETSFNIGIIPFYWDPGFLTTKSSGLFDRNTGKQGYPELLKVIVSVAPPVKIL